jgi:hypothetical protein
MSEPKMLEIDDDPWWLECLPLVIPPTFLVLLALGMFLFPTGPRAKVIRKSEPIRVEIIELKVVRGE